MFFHYPLRSQRRVEVASSSFATLQMRRRRRRPPPFFNSPMYGSSTHSIPPPPFRVCIFHYIKTFLRLRFAYVALWTRWGDGGGSNWIDLLSRASPRAFASPLWYSTLAQTSRRSSAYSKTIRTGDQSNQFITSGCWWCHFWRGRTTPVSLSILFGLCIYFQFLFVSSFIHSDAATRALLILFWFV